MEESTESKLSMMENRKEMLNECMDVLNEYRATNLDLLAFICILVTRVATHSQMIVDIEIYRETVDEILNAVKGSTESLIELGDGKYLDMRKVVSPLKNL